MSSSGSGSGSSGSGSSSGSGGGKKRSKSKTEKRSSAAREQYSSSKNTADGNGNALRSFMLFDPNNIGMGCQQQIRGQEIAMRNPISALSPGGFSLIGTIAGAGTGAGMDGGTCGRSNPYFPPGPPIFDGRAARQAAFASGCKCNCCSCCPCQCGGGGSGNGCKGLNFNGRPVILAFEKSGPVGGGGGSSSEKPRKSMQKRSSKSKKTSSAGTDTGASARESEISGSIDDE